MYNMNTIQNDERNKNMKMQFDNKEFDFEMFNGEYRRYVEEDGARNGEYLCVGVCGTNRILFQYIDATGESVDFVQRVVDNIPDFALAYLIGVLDKNIDVLVRMTFVPVLPTSFEIYYDCDCENNDVNSIIKWMAEHNDFAATEYRYTEVINGHQKCVGE